MINKLPKYLKYFDISRHWKKLKPIYESEEIKEIALYEMNCFLEAKNLSYNLPFNEVKEFQYPQYFDSCDWRTRRIGRPPVFDDWVCHSACHWVVNINAAVVMEAFPNIDWRVVNSSSHSTVWDGMKTVYDPNYLGLHIPIETLIKSINKDPDLYIHDTDRIPFNILKKNIKMLEDLSINEAA